MVWLSLSSWLIYFKTLKTYSARDFSDTNIRNIIMGISSFFSPPYPVQLSGYWQLSTFPFYFLYYSFYEFSLSFILICILILLLAVFLALYFLVTFNSWHLDVHGRKQWSIEIITNNFSRRNIAPLPNNMCFCVFLFWCILRTLLHVS